jgi:hypothetical protein
MSAPPIAAVVVKPLMKLSTVFAPRKVAARTGVAGAIEMKPAMVRALAPKSELLMRCRPGSMRGLDVIRPASFKKATIEPVKVMPPTRMYQFKQDKNQDRKKRDR